jgi:hypothetical protein
MLKERDLIEEVVGQTYWPEDLERAGILDKSTYGCLIFPNGGTAKVMGSRRMLTYMTIVKMVTAGRDDYEDFIPHVVVQVTGEVEQYILNDLHESAKGHMATIGRMVRRGRKLVIEEKHDPSKVEAYMESIYQKQETPGTISLGISGYRKTPIFASGVSVGTSFFDKLFGLTQHVPCALTVLKHLLHRCVPIDPPAQIKGVKMLQDGTVRGVEMLELGEYTFHDAFNHFTRQQTIPVAIYRAQGHLDSEMPYIYTLPKPDSIIFEGDMLFILTRSPQDGGNSGEDKFEDEYLNSLMNEWLSNPSDKGADCKGRDEESV